MEELSVVDLVPVAAITAKWHSITRGLTATVPLQEARPIGRQGAVRCCSYHFASDPPYVDTSEGGFRHC